MSAGRGAPGLLAFLKMNAGRIQIAVFQQPSGFPPDISGAQVSVDEQRRSRYGFGAFKPLSRPDGPARYAPCTSDCLAIKGHL